MPNGISWEGFVRDSVTFSTVNHLPSGHGLDVNHVRFAREMEYCHSLSQVQVGKLLHKDGTTIFEPSHRSLVADVPEVLPAGGPAPIASMNQIARSMTFRLSGCGGSVLRVIGCRSLRLCNTPRVMRYRRGRFHIATSHSFLGSSITKFHMVSCRQQPP